MFSGQFGGLFYLVFPSCTGEEGATAEEGPWLLTLDFPSYLPVMTHSQNRDLREEVYRAFITRASTGETDNTPVIDQILTLRRAKAQLLGFDNFAEVSMASKVGTSQNWVDYSTTVTGATGRTCK